MAVIKCSYKDRLCSSNRIKQCSSISNASRREKELGTKACVKGVCLPGCFADRKGISDGEAADHQGIVSGLGGLPGRKGEKKQ